MEEVKGSNPFRSTKSINFPRLHPRFLKMCVQSEQVHTVLDSKCRNPDIIARNGPAFLSEEHVDLGIAQGCFFDNVQDTNGTLAQKSSERLFILDATGSVRCITARILRSPR